MFNCKSDYAHNKRAKDSIVYISATGSRLRLSRADFASEEEFLWWKRWSDADYRQIEREGREFYDNCISLDECLSFISARTSAEDELFARIDEAERLSAQANLMQQIRDILTGNQYRRLWMHCVDGFSEREIAAIEHVGQQRISKSITAARRKIKKICNDFVATGG